ncbi:hypothetical protein HMPREF0973_03033 [Prevotella veroralis F0319]|uniref:Uncharacterized protein n=1 Tax=Prevotella veroralis F0319 TaxID=649761 RepID=C9MTQ5_9BACT|nr:hypothetical protein HMPREF0973_03033 [Prevotella veroralis F0319]
MGLTSNKQNPHLTSKVEGIPNYNKNKLGNSSVCLLIHFSILIEL